MLRSVESIKEKVEPILEMFDHNDLNTFHVNPTSENMARWVWDRLQPTLPDLSAVIIEETDSFRVEYRGA